MHIVYLHQYFNTLSMPGGTRSFQMAKRLVDMGHRVTMITSWRKDDGRSGWFVTDEEGIEVHWLPVPYANTMSYQKRIVAFLKFAVGATARARYVGGDIVFATSTPLTIAVPAVFSARRLNVPMVFEVRDLWPEVPIAVGALGNPILRKGALWLERWAYKNSEAVVALSPGMRDGVVKAGYPADRVAVIPNSCDNSDFGVDPEVGRNWRSKRPWLGDRPLIIYPGTFGKINGVGYLVDLAAALLEIEPDVRILLIGEGAEKKAILDRAREVGVLDVNLYTEDRIPKSEVPTVFSAANFVCSVVIDMEILHANSANKFFDALAAGKPILLNHGGWQAEIIEKAGCGVVTWGRSMEDAARLLVARLRDENWMSAAGEASKRIGEEHFDRGRLARQLEEVLVASAKGQGAKASVIASGNYDVV